MVAAVSVATCRIGDLIGTPQGALLVVEPTSPDTLKDSSAFGSTAPRPNPVDISNGGDGELRWSASTKHGSGWITLDPDTGTAGVTPLQVVFDPSGLDSGVYQDTVVVEAVSGSGVQEVPLWFNVHPCRTTPISLDDSASTSLTTADCGAPHQAGSFARLYQINNGTANDSLTIEVTAAYDAYVAFDTSLAANANPLARSDDCLGSGAEDPCLYYLRLPRNGVYYVEVTSAEPADTGAFKVRVLHPRAPRDPSTPDQLSADSTPILLGGADSLPSILLRAVVSDPDLGDTLHLEAEVRPVSQGFTGSQTATGSEVPNGSPAYVTQSSLSDNTAYHWRVRAVDQTGKSSGWVEYGANPPSAPDFLVDVPQSPTNPSALGQFEGDSSTSIGTGASARSDTVVLRAQASDPDPADLLRLYVEVKPTGTAFTNNATDSSTQVSVGGVAFVRLGPLTNNVNYHWQAWTKDQTGRSSARVSYGGNSESSTDFRIQVPNLPNAPSGLNQFQSDGSTVIPAGGDANTPTVIFKGTVSDPDVGQTVRLEVEVQPQATPFTNTATATSNLVANGSVAQVNVTSPTIVAGGDYHWQARTVDNTSLGSAWVSFPPDVGPDFHVATTVAELVITQQPVADTAGRPVRPAVIVAARDANHNVVTGFNGAVTMSISTNPAAGSLTGNPTVNAASGIATFSNLIIDKAGTGYRLRATNGVINSLESSAFNVVAAPATVLAFSVEPSNAVAATFIAPPIQVSARDPFGNVDGSYTGLVTMTIAVNAGNPPGTLSGTPGVNAIAGVATFPNLSINKSGVGYRLRAGATSLTPDTSLAFNITPGTATHLGFTVNPTNTAANATITPAVQVSGLDANDNVATSFTSQVTVAIGTNPPGNGILSGTKIVGALSGVATFSNLSIDKIGSNYTLTATAPGVTGGTSAQFNIVNSQVDPNQSSVVANPTTITASSGTSQSTITVTARDNGGNPVMGASTTIAVTGTGNTITPSVPVLTNASGVATFTLSSTVAQVKTITATSASIGITQQASVTVNHAPPTTLAWTAQPTATDAGRAINGSASGVIVTAQDQFGNTATSFNAGVTMTITAGPVGGVFAPTSTNTATAAAGVATFPNLRIYKNGGGYQIQASGGALTSPASNSFTINTAPLVKLGFIVQPVTTADSAPITPAVQVAGQDSVANTITSFTALVRMFIGQPGGGGTLSGTTQTNAVSGVATFSNLRINAMGTGYTLLTTSTGLASDESVPFDIIAGAASKLVFSVQPSQTVAGQVISPAVEVTAQDNQGNTATTYGGNVTLGIGTNPPGNGILTGGGPLPASAGVVSFPAASIDKAGNSYTLTASALGLTGATSVAFNVVPGGVSVTLSTIARAPTSIAASAGAITSTITVTARDGLGNPIQGLPVVLGATGTGNTLTQPAAPTNASGVATGTLSSTVAETKTVSATIDGTLINATTTVVVNPAAPKVLLFNVQPNNTVAGQIIRAGTGVQVEVRDTFNNRVTTASNSVNIAILNNPATPVPGTLSGTTPRTPVGGIVTFNDLSIDKIGTGYTLLTSATGLVSDTSTGFNITAGTVSATLSTVVAAPTSITACDNTPPCTTGNGTASQITVTARDGSGNPISGASVTLSATGSSNGFSPAGPYTTDGSGVATALFRSTVAEGKTISAQINSTSINQTAAVTVTAAGVSAATSTLGASPGTITASNGSSASTITATAKDEFGNPIQNAAVVLAANPTTGNALTQPAGNTNGSGVATGTLSSTKAEDKIVSATIGGVPITQTATVTVNPAAVSATLSSVTTPQTTDSACQTSCTTGANRASLITITAVDQFSNPVGNATVAMSSTGTGNSFTAAANTNSSGVSTSTFSSTKAEGKTITATVNGTAINQKPAVTVIPAGVSASHSSVGAAPGTITASNGSSASTVTVTVRDPFDNPIQGAAVTLTSTGSNNSFGQPGTTNSSGVTTGTISSTMAEPKTVSATAQVGANPAVPIGQTAAVTVDPAAADHLTFTVQPSNTPVDQAMNPAVVVQIRDAFENLVTGATDQVTLVISTDPTSGTAILSNGGPISASGGIATFSSVSINTIASGYRLDATASGLTSATSNLFNIN